MPLLGNKAPAGLPHPPYTEKWNEKEEKFMKCTWKLLQTEQITDEAIEATTWNQIGIVTGKVSGNLEVVDVDCKNHPEPLILKKNLSAAIKETFPLIEKLFLIIKTVNNGFHIVYRCDEIEGNQIFAKSETGKVTIETRGEGGYVVAVPSAGYSIVQGSYDEVPVLTPEQRADLHNVCRQLNEYKAASKDSGASKAADYIGPEGDNPFEAFNKEQDAVKMLTENGWSIVSETSERVFLKRPDDGSPSSAKHSGDWHKELETFKVWTGSTAFEPEVGYNTASVYTMLYHNGDKKKAYHELIELGYGSYPEHEEEVKDVAPEKIHDFEQYRITPTTDVVLSTPLLKVKGGNLFRSSNLSAITAVAGAGKSFLASMLISALRKNNVDDFQTTFKDEDVILHLDTEMSDEDVRSFTRRVQLLSNSDNFHTYGLRKLPAKQRVAALEYYLDTYRPKFVFLDGLTDLMGSVNDEEASNSLVDYLGKIASAYDLHICGIIHQNEGAIGGGKMRGHVGSEFQRKADAVLQVNYNKKHQEFVVQTNKTRSSAKIEFSFTLQEREGIMTPIYNGEITMSPGDLLLESLLHQASANALALTGFQRSTGKKKSKSLITTQMQDYLKEYDIVLGDHRARNTFELACNEDDGVLVKAGYGDYTILSNRPVNELELPIKPKVLS